MNRTAIVIFTLFAWINTSNAWFVGGYPGIDNLIEQSDLIAVVLVINQEVDQGGFSRPPGGIYRTAILHALKGDAPKKTPVKMRLSSFDNDYEDRDLAFIPKPYLLFLHKSNESDVIYSNLNVLRSHWELSRFTDTQKIDGMDIKKAIAYLLKDAVIQRNKDAQLFQETANQVISELEESPPAEPILKTNDNLAQQSGPAYPPQGVGSADP